jgi:hypothetical protein
VPPELHAETVESALATARVPVSKLGSGPVSRLVKSALGRTPTLWITGAILATGICVLGMFLNRGTIERWGLLGPSRSSSVSSADLQIELHPDLAARGVTFETQSRTFYQESGLFTKTREGYSIGLRLRTDRALEAERLEYTFHDADGQVIERGWVRLGSPLAPGTSVDITISDQKPFRASRLVVGPAQ